jgi:hypothetical protein
MPRALVHLTLVRLALLPLPWLRSRKRRTWLRNTWNRTTRRGICQINWTCRTHPGRARSGTARRNVAYSRGAPWHRGGPWRLSDSRR